LQRNYNSYKIIQKKLKEEFEMCGCCGKEEKKEHPEDCTCDECNKKKEDVNPEGNTEE